MAFEPRFAAGAVWGANHNWAEVQQRRLKREGENPVPHYWAHVMWAFGARDMADFLARAADMHLNGVMDRIRVPFLVTHGAKDRQIALDYAQQSYDQLINAPRARTEDLHRARGRAWSMSVRTTWPTPATTSPTGSPTSCMGTVTGGIEHDA